MTKSREEANKEMRALARHAKGDSVTANVLRGTNSPWGGSYGGFGKHYSIYRDLYSGEQPHYIASHNKKGFRITDRDGNKLTPHHNRSGPINAIVVTDHRILYLAGTGTRVESIELDYDQMDDVTLSSRLLGGDIIAFHMNGSSNQKYDGIRYEFKVKYCADRVEDLYNYVRDNI